MKVAAAISAAYFGCYSCKALTVRVPYLLRLSHSSAGTLDLYTEMWTGALMAKNDFNARNSSALEAFTTVNSKCPK